MNLFFVIGTLLVSCLTKSYAFIFVRSSPRLMPLKSHEINLYGFRANRLDSLLKIFDAQGRTRISHLQSQNCHPLIIPLAVDDVGYIGLLPSFSGEFLKVCRYMTKTGQVSIVANSVQDFVMQMAAYADFTSSEDADRILTLANEGSDKPIKAGSTKLSKSLERFLLLNVAPFEHAYQQLTNEHLSRGDIKSALITAERASDIFQEYGSSYSFQARLLASRPGYELEVCAMNI